MRRSDFHGENGNSGIDSISTETGEQRFPNIETETGRVMLGNYTLIQMQQALRKDVL